jgi:hypothetical protein
LQARVHDEGIKYEHGGQQYNLGIWTKPDDWADWKLKITRPGQFEVTAEMAALETTSIEISVGDSKVQGTVYATGNYGKSGLGNSARAKFAPLGGGS